MTRSHRHQAAGWVTFPESGPWMEHFTGLVDFGSFHPEKWVLLSPRRAACRGDPTGQWPRPLPLHPDLHSENRSLIQLVRDGACLGEEVGGRFGSEEGCLVWGLWGQRPTCSSIQKGLPVGLGRGAPSCKWGRAPGQRCEGTGQGSHTWPRLTDGAGRSGGLHRLSVPTLHTWHGPYALGGFVEGTCCILDALCPSRSGREKRAVQGGPGASEGPPPAQCGVWSLCLTCAGPCGQLSPGNPVARQPETWLGFRAPRSGGLDSQDRGTVPLAVLRSEFHQASPLSQALQVPRVPRETCRPGRALGRWRRWVWGGPTVRPRGLHVGPQVSLSETQSAHMGDGPPKFLESPVPRLRVACPQRGQPPSAPPRPEPADPWLRLGSGFGPPAARVDI